MHIVDGFPGFGSIRFVIQHSDGNVGIGTATPSEKLTVAGKIKAEEIIVVANVADFVFEEDYRLMPLAELEQYVKANKHLPDIPSGKEITANGVNLGEMQSKLLQKIEELTLYVIAQDKRLETLEQENAVFKEQIQLAMSNSPE